MINKYYDLGGFTNLIVWEIGQKVHANVLDKQRQQSWEDSLLLEKMIEFTCYKQSIITKANANSHFFPSA